MNGAIGIPRPGSVTAATRHDDDDYGWLPVHMCELRHCTTYTYKVC